ncbi:MAG: WD40 repeat domain-containing protein, partial [Thermomonas sp.]
NPLAIALSPDGSVVAVAGNDLSVRWYDAATLTERGRISLQGQVSSGGQARSIVLLRFIGNHRLRATLEWYANFVVPTDGDTWLLDLQRKTVVLPPVAPGDFSDANYSQDGRFALVRKADNRVQLWQVTPWKPLSEPVAAPGPLWDALPWILSPDGRYAATLDAGMRELHLFDLPPLRYRQTLTLPKHAGISAWASSRDGKALALGDREGRVFVLDVATGGLRSFPATRGREITWLGFSEDDAWLVAGGVNGNAHAFDVASGDSLVSGSMQNDFPIRRVDVDRAQRLLVVAGEGRTALWRIAAGSGSFALARPATRIGIGPAAHGQAGPYAMDWSFKAGLLASAGIDGQVRLWRLPLSPTALSTIPSQRPERLHGLNGRRLVDVAWNRLRLISPDGRAGTPWLVLAQPPGYAELVDAGRTLIVTVGRQLHVYDVASWRLRFAPVTLPNTPQRLLVSPDSRRLLLSFGTSGREGFADSLHLYDVANGKALPGHIELPGPLLALKFAADGRRILAVGPDHHETTVLSSPALAVIGSYPNDPYQPVVDADFDSNGRDVLLVTRAGDARLGTDEFLIWDPKADRVRSRHPTGRARPYGIVALPHGAFVAAESHHMVYDGVDLRNIPRQDVTSDSAVGVIAASRDGRLVAVASQHAVQLYTADGALIGNPLPVDVPPTDGIAEIAFSDDGQSLLARTIWRWQFWPIKAERRPVGQLDTMIARLSFDSEHPQRLIMPSVSERASLRRNDPGAWPGLGPRPVPPMAGYGSIDQSP